MFRGGDKEKYVSVHTEQGWSPSEIAEYVLTVGRWTLWLCPFLHCQKTLHWQHDGLMKYTHCKTKEVTSREGRKLGERVTNLSAY